MTTAEHVEIVQAFLDAAYDQDFRKVMTPAVAASISCLLDYVEETLVPTVVSERD